ncbi:SKIP/SNW domain-containing protein [Polychytrium aggregatum]|uniref:SKIP/SNW domain-containing protein n=1 Tax=Polychytrium aggregatum TaxID=110093 RepID=UPI0022FDBC1A|nr:SKIP/SNW domain-containing protein [Polychytrium aggregatum]KAI9205632.1 SKIP/SNW domain-containing protein [Polychytrium aggregatum]
MSRLSSVLPAPKNAGFHSTSRSRWEDSEDEDEAAQLTSTSHKSQTQSLPAGPPPYGKRKGFIPRVPSDFGDGGAFPEIHVAQYPLDLGKKSQSSALSNSSAIPLQTDSEGNIRYDVVLRGQDSDASGKKVIHSQLSALKEKDILEHDDSLARPDEETVKATTEKTKQALEKLVEGRIKSAQPTQVASAKTNEPEYLRYTPSGSSSGPAQTRIIRMVEAPVDPMEPPKFKHKKVPRKAPSPPPPVMHSPPRKVSAEEQKNWVIPPCISNWKNAKGYTIPLDKRLAADGRGLQTITVNDGFAKLTEALLIADRHAREEVRIRAEMQTKLAQKAKAEKEQQLRDIARKARDGRVGLSASVGETQHDQGEGESAEDDDDEDEEDDERLRERDALRRELRQQHKRELTLSHMGRETKAKVMSKMADRDISEKVALGLAQPTMSKESMYDQRLFNQSAGLSSGFGGEDAYNIYDKPLFSGTSAQSIYRPTKVADDEVLPGVSTAGIEKLLSSSEPARGFKGAEGSGGSGVSGPVQFEKDVADPFGLDEFMAHAKRGRKDDHRASAPEEKRSRRD